MPRLPDKLEIESISPGTDSSSATTGVLNNFTSFTLTNDITMPSECAFEVGDDSTWESIAETVAPGIRYQVRQNDTLRMTGRVELDDIPLDAGAGAVVRFTVRTKLADAMFAGADPSVNVKNVSIKDFILQVYEPLGYAESDFIFSPATARDLLTGVDTSGQGDPVEVDLEPLKEEAARVTPPESIYDAADRHLRRHGLMHWDSPDDKIVVSYPNDTQDPLYFLRANRGQDFGKENNILSLTRTVDYSSIPSSIAVFGSGGKVGTARTRVAAFAVDQDVTEAGFYRPVLVVAQGLKTLNLVERAAARELSARSKQKDAFEAELDGLSYWDGSKNIPWGVDTVASVESNIAGGVLGAYYIHRVVLRRDAGNGDRTNLSLLRRGIWKL